MGNEQFLWLWGLSHSNDRGDIILGKNGGIQTITYIWVSNHSYEFEAWSNYMTIGFELLMREWGMASFTGIWGDRTVVSEMGLDPCTWILGLGYLHVYEVGPIHMDMGVWIILTEARMGLLKWQWENKPIIWPWSLNYSYVRGGLNHSHDYRDWIIHMTMGIEQSLWIC